MRSLENRLDRSVLSKWRIVWKKSQTFFSTNGIQGRFHKGLYPFSKWPRPGTRVATTKK